MVFDGVVKQHGACHVWVTDPVVSEDPDRNLNRLVGIRLALLLVLHVQPGCPRQRILGPAVIGGGTPRFP
jgi:hypothetical protein